MFVVSERNIIIPGPDGQKFHMPRKYMGPVPKWAEESTYFKALVKDKKVIISVSGKDKDVDEALKGRKQGEKKEPAVPGTGQEETPDDPPEPEGNLEKETEDPDGES